MAALELTHEADQRPHALDRHRVVYRGTHSPYQAVPLELREPIALHLLEELFVQGRGAQCKWNVHERAGLFRGRRAVELGLIEIVVDERRLASVDFGHFFEPA